MTGKRKHTDKDFVKTGENLISAIRKTEQIEEEEISLSWEEVDKKAGKETGYSKLRFIRIASVAIFAGIILTGSFYFLWQQLNSVNTLSLSLIDGLNVDTDEVLLITSRGNARMKEEPVIEYDEQGSIKQELEFEEEKTATHVNTHINQIIVPKGKRSMITFADGTVMYVNSESKVIYPTVFDEKKREILLDGEAYFEVTKKQSQPFIVRTKGFDVAVLGTSFNVNAYSRDKTTYVVLVEGSVEVKTVSKVKQRLEPEQLMEITPAKITLRDVDVTNYIAWKDDILMLGNSTLGQILDKLSGYFGITVQYDPAIRNLPIRGKLDLNDEPEEIIETICLSLSLGYKIDENGSILITSK